MPDRKFKNPGPVIPGRRIDWQAGPDFQEDRIFAYLRDLLRFINSVWSSEVVTRSAAYTFSSTDGTVLADASGGGFTLTLPTALGITGRTYTAKKIDTSTNIVTVGTTGGQTIDGSSTVTLRVPETSLDFRSDGSNWEIV